MLYVIKQGVRITVPSVLFSAVKTLFKSNTNCLTILLLASNDKLALCHRKLVTQWQILHLWRSVVLLTLLNILHFLCFINFLHSFCMVNHSNLLRMNVYTISIVAESEPLNFTEQEPSTDYEQLWISLSTYLSPCDHSVCVNCLLWTSIAGS